MQVFDKVKKGFDQAIGVALKGGDRETARMYSMQLRELKDGIALSNPEYAQTLATQRDLFHKMDSLEEGENFLKKLKSGKSRELLDDLQNNKFDRANIRLGMVDALLHLRTKSQDPVSTMRGFMRHKDQRDVLVELFGSNATLARFEKFMRREARTKHADTMISHARQSSTNLFKQQGDADELGAAGDVGRSVVQGAAFGGPLGALSRGVRAIDMLLSGIGPKAQEELARILMSKGETLVDGVKSVEKYRKAREAARVRDAVWSGKAAVGATSGFGDA
jgi:hypothetical protein